MRQVKIWPHVTLVALLCALVGGGAAALWLRHQQNNAAQSLGSAARVERVDGEVGIDHNAKSGTDARWVQATTNTPVAAGDRIYARDNARASVAFTGRNFARLNPRTALDVMYLTDDRTQLALRDGSALFDLSALPPGGLFEVATPQGAFDFDQPGLYEVGINNNNGGTYVSVLSGLARVVGLAGTGVVSKGEMLTLLGQTAADVVLSRLDPAYAGGLLNDYYGYRYPQIYDGRYANYDAYLNDPYYYDPYRRYVSYRYASDYIPGVEDLDAYGDWQDVSDYGECWHPRVDAGWAPYQQGYWAIDDPYGPTWISSEPWGYAPYHYGRWAYAGGEWFWVPEGVNTQPVYAPALVAFVPLTQANEVGWVPLAPGDPYVRTYYDQNWQPHYVGGAPVVQQQIVNINVPGAVTVVPVQNFNNVITPREIVRVDPRTLAQTRPVFDPFNADALRREAMQNEAARRRIDVPQDVARRIESTRVFAASVPAAAPFRPNLAQAMGVEAVPDNRRGQRLQLRDERQAAAAQQRDAAGPEQPTPQAPGQTNAADQERSRRMAALAAQAARGDNAARRQLRQLERRQSAARPQPLMPPQAGAPQAANERAQRMAAQSAQGEQVGLRRQQQAQREAERQRAITAQQQRSAAMRQQAEAQRQAARQPAAQQRPQTDAQRSQQVRAQAQERQQARQQMMRQSPQPQQRVQQQARPQPQAQRPPEQARRPGPQPQQQERRQGPPPQAAKPQPQAASPHPEAAKPQPPGHGGGGKDKGHH